MKKQTLILTIAALILTSFFISCKKEEALKTTSKQLNYQNFAIPIANSIKSTGFEINLRIGHKAQDCNGCFYYNGTWIHKECFGYGNVCNLKMNITLLEDDKNTYFAIVKNSNELFYDNFFLMPARSLYIQGTNGKFLNIPEQLCNKDEENESCILYDIFYSDCQMFSNE